MEKIREGIDFVMDILETVVFMGSIFVVMYLFIIQPQQVKGASMNYSFADGDYILTNKIAYKFDTPQRGDVVVFKSPRNPDVDYIKRIIGLPGDRVMIQNKQIFINGNLLEESYIADKTPLFTNGYMEDGIEITVPSDHLFVMGDNRPHSSDSRDFGPIPIADIIGKVAFRYFPFTASGFIQNPYK